MLGQQPRDSGAHCPQPDQPDRHVFHVARFVGTSARSSESASEYQVRTTDQSGRPAERDRRQDPKNLPRGLDRVFYDIHRGLCPIQLEEPPEDARGHDAVNRGVG